MAADVTIPRLGWSMEEGVFAGWLKKPGDHVTAGEPLFMLEGEKATQEIEAVDGGVLHLAPDAPAEGETVLVGRVIGKLCAAADLPAWTATGSPAAGGASVPPQAGFTAPSPPPTPAGEPVPPSGDAASAGSGSIPAAASPSVRRLARQLGIDLAAVTPRLPGGRLSVDDLAATPSPTAPRSSPRARRVAREHGIDIAAVHGGGASGRVRERDVVAVAAGREAVPAAHVPGATTRPITATRRTIARQMVRSRDETVPVTLTAWADATAVLAARAASKSADGPDAVAVSDILLKILADAILAHPLLAARWDEACLTLPGGRIDIGLAVDAPGGLVVPVIRDVAASPLAEVARRTRALVAQARDGRLAAADMQGGVFTLTSLGSYGVEFFTPVVNLPQAAILGVGAVRVQPVPLPVGPGGIMFQRQMPLSLTFDHRIVDGGPAARFLGDVAARIATWDRGTDDPR